MDKARIIILGGGFAGVKCAKTLEKKLPHSDYEIVVFSLENHMVFHPLLAEVAAASVNPKDMAAPLRELLRKVKTRTEEVTGIDLPNNQIEYLNDCGNRESMKYDQLVISSGNTSNLAFIPGMADHAFPLKTIGDALALQAHVIDRLEKAEVCKDPEKRLWYLSFVIAGGGFSGVELAGELNDLVKNAARFYTNFSKADVCVTLVHSHDEILPEVTVNLRKFALNVMEKHGVKFVLNAHASFCTPEGIGLEDGRFLKAGTVVSTVGSRALAMIERLTLPKNRSRLVTEPDMSLPGYKNAWAIGDCAAVVNSLDGELSPTTGQFAERQGAQVAGNIVARLHGQPTKPFAHHSLGTLCSIGGKNAVAEMMGGIKISGFLAWVVWRGVYLFKLPSLAQKIKVGANWAFDLLFPPSLTSLHTDTGRRIGNAHYQTGDIIYKPGDPATDFFVIEEGEVEVISQNNGKEETVAILGPGDFFGEGSLLEKRARKHLCRARTSTELLVLGKHVFDQFSKAFVPFRKALGDAMNQRTTIWAAMPEIQRMVSAIPLTEVTDPLITEPLRFDHTLTDAVDKINKHRLDFLYVINDQNHLVGLVTRGDLLRAIEVAASIPDKDQRNIKIKNIVDQEPLYVTETDHTLHAVTLMREHGFKRLPVVESKDSMKLKGNIRIENVIDRIIQELKIASAPGQGDRFIQVGGKTPTQGS
jgi:NADH:ubiquinone reductase (H+-translocating)